MDLLLSPISMHICIVIIIMLPVDIKTEIIEDPSVATL